MIITHFEYFISFLTQYTVSQVYLKSNKKISSHKATTSELRKKEKQERQKAAKPKWNTRKKIF